MRLFSAGGRRELAAADQMTTGQARLAMAAGMRSLEPMASEADPEEP